MARYLSLFLFLLFATVTTQAATITSTTAGGSWTATTTWVGGVVPGSADDVVIAGNVSITNTSVSTTGSVTINQDVTLTITAGAANITISFGAIADNGTLKFTGNKTTTFKCGILQLIGDGTFSNGYVSTLNSVPASSFTTTGDITITDTGSFGVNWGSVTVGGNVSITDNGNGGTSFATSGTTTTVTGSVTLNDPNSTFSSTANIIVNGNVSIASGANFQAGNGTFTLGGNFTNSAIGGFDETTNGFGSSGAMVFNGTTTQTVIDAGTSFATGLIFNTITVNANAKVVIGSGTYVTLNGTLSYGAGAGSGTSFDVASGYLLLTSTTDDGSVPDASIGIIPSGATFSGSNVTVQRYIGQSSIQLYRYLSSPVQNATVAQWQASFPVTGSFTGKSTTDPITGLTSETCDGTTTPINSSVASLWYYDPVTAANYVAFPTTSNAATLTPGTGYVSYMRNCVNPTLISVTGAINQGNLTYTVPFGADASGSPATSFSLIGNPYPSTLNWKSVTRTNVQAVAQIGNNRSGSLVFVPVNAAATTALIASGQAFWVANSSGSSGSLGITENAKSTSGTQTYKSAPEDMLVLSLTDGNVTDHAWVNWNTNAKAKYDINDGPKMNNDLFDLSTLSSDNVSLIVNATDSIKCGSTIKIRTKDMTAGSYTMGFAPSGVFSQYTYMLKDAYTGQNLSTTQPYTFTVDASEASQALDRFQLLVSLSDAVITQVNDSTLQANYSSGIQWYYNGTLLPDTTATLVAKKSGTYKFVVTVGTCSSTSREASIALITAIEPYHKLASGYPNPVSSIYTLELPQDGSGVSNYPVLNSQGMNVGTITVSEIGDSRKGQFDFSSYPSGLYLIRTSQNGVIKLIKK